MFLKKFLLCGTLLLNSILAASDSQSDLAQQISICNQLDAFIHLGMATQTDDLLNFSISLVEYASAQLQISQSDIFNRPIPAYIANLEKQRQECFLMGMLIQALREGRMVNLNIDKVTIDKAQELVLSSLQNFAQQQLPMVHEPATAAEEIDESMYVTVQKDNKRTLHYFKAGYAKILERVKTQTPLTCICGKTFKLNRYSAWRCLLQHIGQNQGKQCPIVPSQKTRRAHHPRLHAIIASIIAELPENQ